MAPRLASACLAAAVAAVGGSEPTVRLRNGVEMPLLAAGVWQYNDTEAQASVEAALKVGFTMVDTAHDYNNQVGVGRALRASGLPRQSIFLETKVPGCGGDSNVSRTRCYEDTKAVLELNLQQLNQSYVDLVIVHFPPMEAFFLRTCRFSCSAVREQWKALEEFYNASKARAIGVSNYCPSCFACLDDSAVYPMVNQVSYHIGMGPDPAGFVSFARSKGVVLQAYSPLGNTPWRQGADPDILTGNFTSGLAASHSVSTIQVALKYLVQQGVPAVTKSSNPKHLAADLDLWSWNLTAEEMQAADKYSRFGIPSFACSFAAEAVGGETAEVVV